MGKGKKSRIFKKENAKSIGKVKEWTHKWGFKMSVAKSQLICSRGSLSKFPLGNRRDQVVLAYWVSLEGHGALHPTRALLQECWEHREIKGKGFGRVSKEMAQKISLTGLNISSTVPKSVIPPWKFYTPATGTQLLETTKNNTTINTDMDNSTKLGKLGTRKK